MNRRRQLIYSRTEVPSPGSYAQMKVRHGMSKPSAGFAAVPRIAFKLLCIMLGNGLGYEIVSTVRLITK